MESMNDKVRTLDSKRRRRTARRRYTGIPPTAGNLALLAAALPAPLAPVVRFPMARRWIRERHPALGFRFADALYFFSLARQALDREGARGWAYLRFCDPWGPEHAAAVLAVLAPGAEPAEAYPELLAQVRQAYAEAVDTATADLIGAGPDTPERARELQTALEALYDEQGWSLPGIPLALVKILREAGIDPLGY